MIETTDQINNMEGYNLVIANAHKFGTNSNVDIDNIRADLFDLVIVDEAHHYPARTWRSIIDYFQLSKKLFLTAVGIFIFEYLYLISIFSV
jgi:superfamily II DNA or RNA helicase